MVDGFSVHQFLVRVPPNHAALIGTEFFRLAVRNLYQGYATHRASAFCWWLRRVATTEGLHAIHRQAQRGGDALIAQPLALQILNPLFFFAGHFGHLISEEASSSQVGHGKKKN